MVTYMVIWYTWATVLFLFLARHGAVANKHPSRSSGERQGALVRRHLLVRQEVGF